MKKEIVGTPREIAGQLFNLDQDKLYVLKEKTYPRSKDANAKFHKLINELAKKASGSGYIISNEEMKRQMNIKYSTVAVDENGNVIEVIVPHGIDISNLYPYSKLIKGDEAYDYYIFYKRTSELNTQEFYELLNGVIQECNDLGIPTEINYDY